MATAKVEGTRIASTAMDRFTAALTAAVVEMREELVAERNASPKRQARLAERLEAWEQRLEQARPRPACERNDRRSPSWKRAYRAAQDGPEDMTAWQLAREARVTPGQAQTVLDERLWDDGTQSEPDDRTELTAAERAVMLRKRREREPHGEESELARFGISFAVRLPITEEGTTMPNVTVSVPHQLGRAEARRRIEQQIRELKMHFGHGFATLEDRWVGDELSFQLRATGQTVTGRAIVEEQQVWIEVELPWLLAALANLVRQELKDRGRLLLGNMATTGRSAGT